MIGREAKIGAVECDVFLINLDRSSERLAAMNAQLSRHGISFKRLAGVDGVENVPARLRSQFDQPSRMKGGEIGCYASHLLIYEEMVERGLAYALVLEDDVDFDGELAGIAREAAISAPEDWDVIHLSTNFKRPAFPVCPLRPGRAIVRYARLPVNSAAYLISSRGAAKLLEKGPRKWPIDMEFRYAWHRGLEVYGVFPSPACQREGVISTISSQKGVERVRAPLSVDRLDFEPGLLSRLRGWFYVKRRLGVLGTVYCWAQRWGIGPTLRSVGCWKTYAAE